MDDLIDWPQIDPLRNRCETLEQWGEYVERCHIVHMLDLHAPGGMQMWDGERWHVRVVKVEPTRIYLFYADLKTGDGATVRIDWRGGIECLDS